MDSGHNREASSAGSPSPIRQFAIKTVIVACACVVSFVFIASYVDDLVQSRVDHIHALIQSQYRIGGREFWVRIEKILDEQADPKNDLSPEKRQKMLAQIRTISDRWRPFVTEALGGDARDSARPKSQ